THISTVKEPCRPRRRAKPGGPGLKKLSLQLTRCLARAPCHASALESALSRRRSIRDVFLKRRFVRSYSRAIPISNTLSLMAVAQTKAFRLFRSIKNGWPYGAAEKTPVQ